MFSFFQVKAPANLLQKREIAKEVPDIFHKIEDLRMQALAGNRLQFIELFENYFGEKKLTLDAENPFLYEKFFNNENEFNLYLVAWETYEFVQPVKLAPSLFSEKLSSTDAKSRDELQQPIIIYVKAAKIPIIFKGKYNAFVAEEYNEGRLSVHAYAIIDQLAKMLDGNNPKNEIKQTQHTKKLDTIFNSPHMPAFSDSKELDSFFEKMLPQIEEKIAPELQVMPEYFELDEMVKTIKIYLENSKETFTLDNAKGIILLSYIYAHQSTDFYYKAKEFFLSVGFPDNAKVLAQAEAVRNKFIATVIGARYQLEDPIEHEDSLPSPHPKKQAPK